MIRDDLPGAELLEGGPEDLARGRETVAALLVAIAAPRLRRLGIPVPPDRDLPRDPEERLYRLLGREHGDPYGLYNSLLRRLTSFARALERERRSDAT